MSERLEFRGYIGSRSYNGSSVPQHVQNLVVRDYCQRKGFEFLLSVTEYSMPGCYIMLEEAVREAHHLGGIVLYSIFMLPKNSERRHDIVRRVFDAGASVHGAVENVALKDPDDLKRAEDIWSIRGHLENAEPWEPGK